MLSIEYFTMCVLPNYRVLDRPAAAALMLCSYLWLATGLKNYLEMVVSVVNICSRTMLQSIANNLCKYLNQR